RELEIKNQETELLSLRQQVQEFPERLNRELAKKVQEVKAEDEKEWKSRLEAIKKEWEAEKRLLEMNIATLEERFKRHDAENVRLKQEAELAHKKAQELAVKVIESGTRMRISSDEQAAE
ncbi:MAG: hypothetical protein Q8M83_02250, partial [bacterium]|nr:hypothetical protein [bacterium]